MASKNKRPNLDLLDILHAYSLDIKHREIYLVGEPDVSDDTAEPGVEHLMASRFIKNLRFLSVSSKEPILVHMKTCGGYWEEGMAVYDAIRACPCHTTLVSYTHARSMSSIILQAADCRVLMPNSYFMYHHGDYQVSGDWTKVISNVDWDRRTEKIMLDIYAEKLNKKGVMKKKGPSKIKAALVKNMQRKIDVFLTAQEAVDWGFADQVFRSWDNLK
jgi:ATP-dependent protease ClpP protease subunit